MCHDNTRLQDPLRPSTVGAIALHYITIFGHSPTCFTRNHEHLQLLLRCQTLGGGVGMDNSSHMNNPSNTAGASKLSTTLPYGLVVRSHRLQEAPPGYPPADLADPLACHSRLLCVASLAICSPQVGPAPEERLLRPSPSPRSVCVSARLWADCWQTDPLLIVVIYQSYWRDFRTTAQSKAGAADTADAST